MNIPKIPCAVLKCWQTPMLGADIHDNLMPPAIPSIAPLPYIVFTLLPAPWGGSAKYSFSVLSSGNGVVLRGSDAGSLIPHVGNPLNVFFPVMIATSASKTEFGVFSVKMEKEPVAAAFPLVFVTLNLNCAGPTTQIRPSLKNIVIAPNTHFVGMGIGDIVASCAAMAVDMAIQAAINYGCGKFGNWAANRLLAVAVRETEMVTPAILKSFLKEIPIAIRNKNAVSTFVGGLLADLGIGSPLGTSSPITPLGAVTNDDINAVKGDTGGLMNEGYTHGIANPLNNLFNGGESM